MSKVVYKYIEEPREHSDAIEFMQKTLMPMLNEYWAQRGKSMYGCDMSFNVLTFTQMWIMGSLLIIIAYEDDKPGGFFIGVRFVPLLYNATAVQAEVYYGRTREIQDGLFKYLMNIIGFMGINEIWISSEVPGDATVPWPKKHSFTVDRHVKA